MLFDLRPRRALKALGGPLRSPSQLAILTIDHTEDLQHYLKFVTHIFRKDKRFWFEFCQADQLNAYAVPLAPNQYFLSITCGLAFKTYLATVGLARNSNTFSNLLSRRASSIAVDARLRQKYEGIERSVHRKVTEFDSLLKSLHKSFANKPALSVQEAQLAFTVAHYALQFVLAHEIGHIFSGHLELPFHVNKRRIAALPRKPDIPDDFTQHFEISADEWACLYAFGPLVSRTGRHDYNEGPYVPAAGCSYFYNRKEVIELWLYSVGFLFTILEEWSGTGSDYFQSTHPFPAYRMERVFEYLRRQDFGELIAETRFTDPHTTIKVVVGDLKSAGLVVPNLLPSLRRYVDEGHRVRIDEKIQAGLARDQVMLSQLQVQTLEPSLIPQEPVEEGKLLINTIDACLEILGTRKFESVEEVLESPEFVAMKSSAAFSQLLSPNMKRVVGSLEFDALFTHSAGGDPAAVAFMNALKEAFK